MRSDGISRYIYIYRDELIYCVYCQFKSGFSIITILGFKFCYFCSVTMALVPYVFFSSVSSSCDRIFYYVGRKLSYENLPRLITLILILNIKYLILIVIGGACVW
jgi:hypothetical protein